MFRPWLTAITLCAVLPAGQAIAKVRVAASINDLASIASSVGGDQVEVFAIARPTADVHRVEALPSYMVKVSRARIYLKVGLGLDQWAEAIIDGSRNPGLKLVDCSRGVRVLEVPTGRVDASMGDVHPNGNPHYWLEPRNGRAIARTIAEALAQADPPHAADYRARAESFAKEAEATWAREKEVAATLPQKTIFTYHRSWSYFADAFGLEVAATVEPVPGIPPTARHLADLVATAKSRRVLLLLQEPYFSADAGRFLAREAGVRTVVAMPCCDATTAGSYLAHFGSVLRAVTDAVDRRGTP
ncbi:MAG: metal ABC transporter substrate-binding protein [Candidatus Eiseniibacteriota bacterium]